MNNAAKTEIFRKIKPLFTNLKLQSCKLYNDKYMIAPIQLANIEVFTFIAVLVSKLLCRKVLFINMKDNRNC